MREILDHLGRMIHKMYTNNKAKEARKKDLAEEKEKKLRTLREKNKEVVLF